MGWYVKCEFCGKEEKGNAPICECYFLEMKRILQKRIGTKILDAFIKREFPESDLFEKLQDASGQIFYTQLIIANESYEEGLFLPPLIEIDEKSFNQHKKADQYSVLDSFNINQGDNDAIIRERIGQTITSVQIISEFDWMTTHSIEEQSLSGEKWIIDILYGSTYDEQIKIVK